MSDQLFTVTTDAAGNTIITLSVPITTSGGLTIATITLAPGLEGADVDLPAVNALIAALRGN